LVALENTLKQGLAPYLTSASPKSAPEESGPAPVFATTSDATPQPTPEPAVSSSPTPAETTAAPSAPETVDLATLERRFWPRQVKLSKAVEFAIVINGQAAGKASVPAGMMVKLLEIQGAQLSVEMATGSAPKMISADDTDIQERVREIKSMATSSDSTSTSTDSSAAPAATPWVPMLQSRHGKNSPR